jgi:hypothetical protein
MDTISTDKAAARAEAEMYSAITAIASTPLYLGRRPYRGTLPYRGGWPDGATGALLKKIEHLPNLDRDCRKGLSMYPDLSTIAAGFGLFGLGWDKFTLGQWLFDIHVEIDFLVINRAAIPALPAILARLLPGGRIESGEYVALNPCRADRRLGSFKGRVSGQRAGIWSDFATGDKGCDPISPVANIESIGQVEAARRLAHLLGMGWGRRR